MENFLIYSVKTMFVQLLFLLLYEAFFKNEPYFRINRFFLLSGIALSLILPFFPISLANDNITTAIRLEEFVAYANTTSENMVIASNTNAINWYEMIYGIGAVCFGLLFIIKIIRLNHLLNRSQRVVLNGTRIFLLEDLTQAFTFMNNIYVGKEQAEETCVIEHEKVHQKQWHSLDLLFLELMKIVFWFNPLLYFYQKRLVEAHEFEADRQTYPKFQNCYYQTLINQALGTKIDLLTSYWSAPKLIKRRLSMLQQKQKSTKGMSKYLLAIPALAVSVLMLSAGNAPQNNLSENLPKISVTEAQLTNNQVVNDTIPFMKVDKAPRFKECENVSESESFECFKKGLDAHIVRNFKYPKEAAEKDLQGRVNVLFSIGTDGKVSIKSMSGGEKELQEEAKRLIETLPQLIPGQHQGKNAAVMFLYPINFKLAK
ncbi:Antirepressor regulating drug resistance, predicted signal transduction N-terminal membrane component [Capnocytophaga canimorsus]|nr:TonB [Capnocytophaga canimorsus]VEJ20086.1 Antirepressor regulating drug resistance, predicted signal transduction N-terminal membrane component [Capnocytophaga canimorsus]